jgi:hypothetical protein
MRVGVRCDRCDELIVTYGCVAGSRQDRPEHVMESVRAHFDDCSVHGDRVDREGSR